MPVGFVPVTKIKHHVYVFGAKFVAVEFTITALAGGSLAVFFGISRHISLVVIFLGITLNCLVILAYGIQEIAGKPVKEPSQLHDRQTLIETLTLSVAIIVPFALFILTGYERVTQPRIES